MSFTIRRLSDVILSDVILSLKTGIFHIKYKTTVNSENKHFKKHFGVTVVLYFIKILSGSRNFSYNLIVLSRA
jgi:hypothetical protein